ncbi:Protein srg1 [Ranunculus cassubicifolius]
MQKLHEMELELDRLHMACKEWGFFQLVNHEVLVDKIKQEIQDFFEPPLEEKKKFWQYENEVEGFGQSLVV